MAALRSELDVSYLSRADLPMLEAFRKSITPRVRRRPSEWAEENVVLTSQQGADRPGPYQCGYYPWLRTFHDILHDNPAKKGVVVVKPSQVGFTLAAFNIIASWCATNDVNILYLISRKEEAQSQVAKRWDPLVKSIPVLAERFEEAKADDQRQVMLERPYRGGGIDFAGAGSASAVSSRTYPALVVDEWDQCEANFPSRFGGLMNFVLGRQPSRAVNKVLIVFSHPTLKGQGVDQVYTDFSDQSRWVWDCPHCGETVDPAYELIHFREHDDHGKPIPETAELRCARCNSVITDDERARAVWSPKERKGGTGRLWSPMPAEDAATRDYIGFGTHRLSDPYISVVEGARKVERAPNERERQSAMNVFWGEPYKPKAAVIDANRVEEIIRISDRIQVPGGRKGCWYLTVGTDVQAPRENPTLVSAAVAWSGLGHAFVVDLVAMRGKAAYLNWLSGLTVALSDAHAVTGLDRMGLDAVGIDDAWPADEIKDLCRTVIYSRLSSAHIELVPMRFTTGTVSRDVPFKLRDERKRTNPTRPELGTIPMYDLHRHPWVDRTARRVSEGTISVLCRPPHDFSAQMTANVLRPVEQKHSWEAPRLEWEKIKDARDDWMMALVYAEAVAAITLELDSIHELAHDDEPGDGPGMIVPSFSM